MAMLESIFRTMISCTAAMTTDNAFVSVACRRSVAINSKESSRDTHGRLVDVDFSRDIPI